MIRPLDRQARGELYLLAKRMRATLIEVLGNEEGRAMYSLAWLRGRALFHLDPKRCTGEIFVSVGDDGRTTGHCIVRVEQEANGAPFGLFSTTYVAPSSRRRGIAEEFLRRGEAWMVARGLRRAATDTSSSNAKLIALYRKHGYEIVLERTDRSMVRLAKRLD